ncbi:DUF1206 domain-containing protein [Myxosarcina sp. GI1]|uniref:DUF1206 domain-containing protein n=1 Tax=Myxosarcina sp. GI1 TaxID=1541065 RepID=UPI00055A7CCC|nr:DUF1206 domain-containing protein [Myxosarcina sp. GI1]
MQQQLKNILGNPWANQFILVGYVAKGILYFLIGVLAIRAAFMTGKEAVGTYNTLVTLGQQPWGGVFLCFLGVGLMGYVLRRFLQAVLDPGYSDSSNLKRILHRLGYIMSGFSYAGIAYSALDVYLELGEQDDKIEDVVKELFMQPFGKWLVFLGGIFVVGIGLSYMYGAYTGSYISDFRSRELWDSFEEWAIATGKVGVASRGVAFVLTGSFLIQAVVWTDIDLAGGLENAFQIVSLQPLGWLWLGLIGMGFVAYGLYLFVSVRYRRFILR